MKNYIKNTSVLFISFALLITSCNNEVKEKPEILIYCGITMVKPMREISDIIEKSENCKITISRGATEDLYNSAKRSKIGDLFLSGSHIFVERNSSDSLLLDGIDYSYNQPAIFVQKGNPKKITADVKNFANNKYTVLVGNPESCAIGIMTKHIFDSYGIYDNVFSRSVSLASDSRDINRILRENSKIDLAMNWLVTSEFKENINHFDILELPDSIAHKEILSIYYLKFSKQKDLAQKIMNYVVSKEGITIFNKYGFKKIEQ
ncbi:MAG: substrate-binding domain-containing protein [Melioribacteraceae bacterium]|jgi:molybdate transport system substrate-binding protein|nr:substrate-binding domain-containing protein [Melioribacteraceae bacterium]